MLARHWVHGLLIETSCSGYVSCQCTVELPFKLPERNPKQPFVLQLDVVSCSYVGVDKSMDIEIDIQENVGIKEDRERLLKKKVCCVGCIGGRTSLTRGVSLAKSLMSLLGRL